mmetsp:Transcript_65211/g.155736  ORF Transcript_65211/g.155736 Transcript_65211/m.155736 type:complete len:643 (+) Transcript_65211:95-2023(+)
MVRRFNPGKLKRFVNLFRRHKRPEDEESSTRYWTLEFEDSVYDQALLTPMVRLPRMHGLCEQAILMFSISCLLFVNIALQAIVLEKVVDLTSAIELGLQDRLLQLSSDKDVRPVCRFRKPGELPVPNRLNVSSPDDLYSCAPISATMMTNASQFDVDGDGYWTQAEALDLGNEWRTRFNRVSHNTQSLLHMLKLARTGALKAQASLSESEWATLTKDFQKLPMDWLSAEVSELELCLVLHEDLCGNLEARGILETRVTGRNPADRVAACRRTISSECPRIFGQIYTYFQLTRGEVCGSYSHTWKPDIGVQIVESELWLRYAGSGGKSGDALTSAFFRVFLMLILVIWWMAMFKEVRVVADWWILLYLMPSRRSDRDATWMPPPRALSIDADASRAAPDGRGTYQSAVASDGGDARLLSSQPETKDEWPVKDADDIEIEAIPIWVKVFTILMAVLPRTLIAIRLSWAGTKFLTTAGSYEDLVLNAVALTVLIDIDAYIYAAVVGSSDKAVHQQILPLERPIHEGIGGTFCPKRRLLPSDFMLTVLLIVITNFCVYKAYHGNSDYAVGTFRIAEALTCYCQAEGESCITAQILGGRSHVNSAVALDVIPSAAEFGWQNLEQSMLIFRDALPNLALSVSQSWGLN